MSVESTEITPELAEALATSNAEVTDEERVRIRRLLDESSEELVGLLIEGLEGFGLKVSTRAEVDTLVDTNPTEVAIAGGNAAMTIELREILSLFGGEEPF